MPIDRDYVRDTLVRLIRIDSVNPTLAPGAPGEREIAAFIADGLRRLGGSRSRPATSASPAASPSPGVWRAGAAGAA